MLNEYLSRIRAFIADLRAQLDGGDIPAEVAAKIRERLE